MGHNKKGGMIKYLEKYISNQKVKKMFSIFLKKLFNDDKINYTSAGSGAMPRQL